jgi:hypothetical protein
VVPERTAQAFREAAAFMDDPKRVIPRLQELESDVLARSRSTVDPLEAALSEMETKKGFAPARDVKQQLLPDEFSQHLRDGVPIRDVAFKGTSHEVNTHRAQWWALSREMECNPAAFGHMSPLELYRSYGEYWRPVGSRTKQLVLWDETFDSSTAAGPWSPDWFTTIATSNNLPGLQPR